MKLTTDDPALTAFALGELNETDAAALARAFEHDPLLAKEEAAISGLASLLSETLGGERFSLGGDRHHEIFKSGHRPDANILVLDHKRRSRRQSFIAVAGVAAVVVAGFIGLSNFGVDSPRGSSDGSDVAGSGNSGVGVNSSDASPDHQEGDKLIPSENPSIVLPLNLALAVPGIVESALAREGKLPAADEFEIAGWVNLTPRVTKPEIVIGEVGVSAELGSCPWNSDRALLLVSLHSLDDSRVALNAELNFDPDRVKTALMVGGRESTSIGAAAEGSLEGSQSYLYELELIPGDEKVGSINLEVTSIGGSPLSGYLPLAASPTLNRSVSKNFEVARTLAGFAKWGAGSERDLESLREIAISARALLTVIQDEKARYALDAVLLAEEHLGK